MPNPQLIENKAGNYKVLPSGVAYCSGVVPDPGYEVVRVELQHWLPLEQAYAFIESHLKNLDRPVQAFCGIELRIRSNKSESATPSQFWLNTSPASGGAISTPPSESPWHIAQFASYSFAPRSACSVV